MFNRNLPQVTRVSMPPYQLLLMSGLVLAIYAGILGHSWLWINDDATREMIRGLGGIGRAIYTAIAMAILGAIYMAILGVILGAIYGAIGEAIGVVIYTPIVVAIYMAILGAIYMAIYMAILGAIALAIYMAIGEAIGVVIGMAIGIAINVAISILVIIQKQKPIKNAIERTFKRNFYDRGFKDGGITFYLLTTTVVGILTGVGSAFGFNPVVVVGLLVSGLPLAVGLIYPPLKLWKLK